MRKVIKSINPANHKYFLRKHSVSLDAALNSLQSPRAQSSILPLKSHLMSLKSYVLNLYLKIFSVPLLHRLITTVLPWQSG